MSMEEVQDRERELDDMRNAIRDYATLAPIDLFKPSEIQKHLLRIADGEPWQAPEPRIIPDGAHHSGLMKDYGGRYNPASIATPAPSTGKAERHTFEALLAPVEPSRPWQHNYAVCIHCGKTEAACKAAQQQEQEG